MLAAVGTVTSRAVAPDAISTSRAPLRVRELLMTLAGIGLSGAIIAAVMLQLGGVDPAQFARLPREPWFWLVFVLSYALPPIMDWWILHRLWKLRLDALPALFRKQVANEIVLGYSGDAQFYLWARRRQAVTGSVFGTLRDVTVLSALAGNLATLLMMAVTAPLLYTVAAGVLLDSFSASIAVIILSSLLILAMRRVVALFTLSPRDLVVTFALHGLRILLSLILTALLWKLLLPDLTIAMLVSVATLRLMVHRLPMVPAREALLAPIVLALLGPASGLAAATLLIASLTLATHLLVGTLTSISGIAARLRGDA